MQVNNRLRPSHLGCTAQHSPRSPLRRVGRYNISRVVELQVVSSPPMHRTLTVQLLFYLITFITTISLHFKSAKPA
jgi:hypothetical protein